MIGCSAGFLNGVKIKGSHTAIKSGMVAAEAAYDLLAADPTMAVAETGEINTEEPALEIEEYPVMMDKSWVRLMGCIRPCLCLAFYFPSRMRGVRGFVAITPSDGGYGAWRNVLFVASCDTSMWVVQVYDELKEVRNCHASFEHGLVPGLAYTALSSFVLKGRESWTLQNHLPDSAKTKPASEFTPIEYPKPDGEVSFDLLTSLQRSGTDHEHNQPAHLRVKPELGSVPSSVSLAIYAGPEQRYACIDHRRARSHALQRAA